MYDETVEDISGAAAAQVELIKESLGAYIVHSGMAGAYLGLIVIMTFAFGTAMYGTAFEPMRGFVMAAVFGGALSLVIIAGSELFTGNNMIMTVGALAGRVSTTDVLSVFTWSWIGNFLGSIFLGALAWQAGVFDNAALFEAVGATKMSLDVWPLFFRAMLCNWLVCLAVWSNFQLENPVAKLIMIWWCLLAFIGSGYEHSIANMTILFMSNVLPHSAAAVSWSGMAYNLAVVTAGNVTSGVLFMGAAYWYISKSYGHTWDWSMEDNVSMNVGGSPVPSEDD